LNIINRMATPASAGGKLINYCINPLFSKFSIIDFFAVDIADQIPNLPFGISTLIISPVIGFFMQAVCVVFFPLSYQLHLKHYLREFLT
jgi:hypothetical protein